MISTRLGFWTLKIEHQLNVARDDKTDSIFAKFGGDKNLLRVILITFRRYVSIITVFETTFVVRVIVEHVSPIPDLVRDERAFFYYYIRITPNPN